MLVNIGSACLGAFVGLLTALVVHRLTRTKMPVEKAIKTLREIIGIAVLGVIGPAAGIGLLLKADAAGCYAIGLFVGFLLGFCWREFEVLWIVQRAKRAGAVAAITVTKPDRIDAQSQEKVLELLDDINPPKSVSVLSRFRSWVR